MTYTKEERRKGERRTGADRGADLIWRESAINRRTGPADSRKGAAAQRNGGKLWTGADPAVPGTGRGVEQAVCVCECGNIHVISAASVPVGETAPAWMKEAAEEIVRGAYTLHKFPIIGNAVEVEAAELVKLLQRHAASRAPAGGVTAEDARAWLRRYFGEQIDLLPAQSVSIDVLCDYLVTFANHCTAGQRVKPDESRNDYNEPFILAKQRVDIVDRVMKVPYIKAVRNTDKGQERFVCRDDVITAIHDYAKIASRKDSQ